MDNQIFAIGFPEAESNENGGIRFPDNQRVFLLLPGNNSYTELSREEGKEALSEHMKIQNAKMGPPPSSPSPFTCHESTIDKIVGFDDKTKLAFFDVIPICQKILAAVGKKEEVTLSSEETESIGLILMGFGGLDGADRLSTTGLGQFLSPDAMLVIGESPIEDKETGKLGMRLIMQNGTFTNVFTDAATIRAEELIAQGKQLAAAEKETFERVLKALAELIDPITLDDHNIWAAFPCPCTACDNSLARTSYFVSAKDKSDVGGIYCEIHGMLAYTKDAMADDGFESVTDLIHE